MESISGHIITSDAPIISALDRLDRLPGGRKTLFVTDGAGVLGGALTDGDIRRALLRGIPVTDPVERAMFRGVRTLPDGVAGEHDVYTLRKEGLRLIPSVDSRRRITGIIDLDHLHPPLPVDAVLMAGGKGERLRPATLTTPKPLLPIAGKPIIDYNIEALTKAGVSDIYVTVNYLHGQIEAHFRNTPVKCVLEPRRMGTLGAVSLIKTFSAPDVLIMNSDLLTTLDFRAMHARHAASGADITMAVTNYTVSVPFAIVETDGDKVRRLAEKPVYNYFANAGVYIVRRELLEKMPEGEYLDAPDFISAACAQGRDVRTFPIVGTWIDVGSPDDFRTAEEFMRRQQ